MCRVVLKFKSEPVESNIVRFLPESNTITRETLGYIYAAVSK